MPHALSALKNKDQCQIIINPNNSVLYIYIYIYIQVMTLNESFSYLISLKIIVS